MASFTEAVLHQPEIAAIVFEFQFGVYEDVLARFRAFNDFVNCELVVEHHTGECVLDPAFHTTLRGRGDLHEELRVENLCLNALNERDARFPLHFAIAEGDLSATKRIIRCRADLVFVDAIAAAAMWDRLEIAAYLSELRKSNSLLDRTYDDSCGIDTWVPKHLVETGNLDMLRILRDHRRAEWSHELLDYAIANTDAETTAFLYQCMPDAIGDDFMDDAARMGLLDIVIDLHHQGRGCPEEAIFYAAGEGHLDIVKFLHAHVTEDDMTDAMDAAVEYGHMDIVRFLIEHECDDPNRLSLDLVAYYGHLELFKYLEGLGGRHVTTAAVDSAVAMGHLHVVEYLLTHRSEGGSRDTVVLTAMERGRNDMTVYLVSAGYPFPTTAELPLEICLTRPEARAVVQLLLDHKIPFTPAMLTTVRAHATGDVLQLVEAHFPASALTREALVDPPNAPTPKVVCRRPKVVVADWHSLQRAACAGRELTAPQLALLEASVTDVRYMLTSWCKMQHFPVVKLVLPYCMDDANPIDNVKFLVDWCLECSQDANRATLLLFKAEMVRQATTGNILLSNTDAGVNVETLAATLLALGATIYPTPGGQTFEQTLDKPALVDWGLTALFVHFWTVDPVYHVEALVRWADQIANYEMKTRLQRLLKTKMKRLGHALTLVRAVEDLRSTKSDY